MLIKIKRTFDNYKDASFVINPDIIRHAKIETMANTYIVINTTNGTLKYVFEDKKEAEAALDALVKH